MREPPATPSPDGAILLAGHGHGAHAAFDGLARVFSKIDLLGADDALAARTTGRCHDTLRTAPHDVVVMAGHRDIVPPDELARRVFINVHYSLLPKYRGLHSVVWAILNDEPELGCSVHLADAGIDSGPLLHQHAIPRPDGMTSHEAMERLNAHVAAELGHVVHRFLAGEIKPSPQDHAAATWVPRRNLDDCLIDFTETHRQLALFFDALVEPYPLPQIRCSAGRFEIVEHDLVARDYRTHLGRVVNVDAAGAWIKIREGLLVVKRLRPLGGATVDAAEVLRPGERLA